MEIRPYIVDIPEDALDDLRTRLKRARFPRPDPLPGPGPTPRELEALLLRWREAYDWRRVENELNDLGLFETVVDSLTIRFLHVRSPMAHARPLFLSHGWPGSVIEFLDAIPALIDPVAHGGRSEDAFHLVIPCLPGFGFSEQPRVTGWSVERIADAFHAVILALGYERYFAQGGDWGAMISTALLNRFPEHCRGIHLNMVVAPPPPEMLLLPTKEESAEIAGRDEFNRLGSAYAMVQATRPMTIGYGLVDSPGALAAWVLEKFAEWTHGPGFGGIREERLLDNLMLYWLPAAGASAARIYRESYARPDLGPVTGPAGCTIFPGELFRPSRRWAEGRFKNIVYWNEAERGGHFAALEAREIFVREIRACFRVFADRGEC